MLIPVVIIGAGPAGIMAAIQLKRSGIDFQLFEKNRIGGLLHEANRVENFPGIARGVAGKTLAARLKRQLSVAGIKIIKDEVRKLEYRDGQFMIHAKKMAMKAAKIILACGTRPLPVGPPLDRLPPCGRIFSSVLPLLKCTQKTIVIIGGGDAAFDYALNLAGKNQVHIVFRSGRPCALPLLLDRCRSHPHITIHENSPLLNVRTGIEADGIVLEAGNQEIFCQMLLTAVGREPALYFLEPDLAMARAGLQAQKKLFIVGDTANGRFRQAVIAAADGLRAAMEINAGK